jgi:glycosyltransferase involved in cell wall biosynthesis
LSQIRSELLNKPDEPLYSICITHYNNVKTLEASLNSILDQIDSSFEVVLVDNYSNDGSDTVLTRYSKAGRIKLIRAKCSRGRGRQIAFENSSSKYIISNLDMDEVYERKLGNLVQFYHACCEGNLLLVVSGSQKDTRNFQNVTIATRSLIEELGGWNDIQYGEDWDIESRAAKIGRYFWTEYNLLKSPNQHPERSKLLNKIRLRYVRYRDFMRLHRRYYFEVERMSLSQWAIYLLAKMSLPLYQSYGDDFNQHFNPYDPTYFKPWLDVGKSF